MSGRELWVTLAPGAVEGRAHLSEEEARREKRRQALQFVKIRILRVRVQAPRRRGGNS